MLRCVDNPVDTVLRQQINENSAACVARTICAEIQAAGHEAHIVGGGVRDLLLGRNPEDFDVATSATPDVLKRLYPQAMLVGAKFGVILVRRDDVCVEVATFREEGEYHDRRRPDLVRFSDLKSDAERRDFTINALYYDPVADELTDLVGGVQDLEARTLQTVKKPLDRFQEDVLRVIRALRFAANLDFEIEERTWEAICQSMPYLKEISMERVRDEVLKGLTGGQPNRFLDLLDTSGFLNEFLPEVTHLKGCEQPAEFHPEGDVYIHTRLMLKLLKQAPSPELALAVLLHDIGKPPTQTYEDRIRFNGHDKMGAEMAGIICQRLKLSNAQIDAVVEMVGRHMQFVNVPSMRRSTLSRFLASPLIEDELELHRVDCVSSHGNLDTYEYTQAKLQEFREAAEYQGRLPKPLVNGDDLIAMGMVPGPAFAGILRTVFDAQLEGRIATKEDGLHLARAVADGTAAKPS